MASCGLGFPRSARLLRPEEYRRVFENALRVSSPAFTVLVRERDDSGIATARLGLAISRKCARRAVDRNRIKRIVRESFRHHAPELPPVDVVVLCRPQAIQRSSADLRCQLDGIWNRLKGPGEGK